jgi:hypothetical protein
MFKHILGFIFGLLLGIIILLFLRKNKYKGPDSNEVKKKVFKYNDKYYKFTTEICFCPIK